MKVDGACLCGAILIEAEADPEKTVVCHCTDCQTGTGSAFRVSVPVSGESFKLTGKPAIYIRTTGNGRRSSARCRRPRRPVEIGTFAGALFALNPAQPRQQ